MKKESLEVSEKQEKTENLGTDSSDPWGSIKRSSNSKN